MRTELFNYHLPKELIAQRPPVKRDRSRLMIADRKTSSIHHKRFYELPDFLQKGDALIINNTKVLPARLFGAVTDRSFEVLLIRNISGRKWEVLIKPGKKIKLNSEIIFDENNLKCKVCGKTGEGAFLVEFSKNSGIFKSGYMPLPPYIKRDYKNKSAIHDQDRLRYQTVFADTPGAIAAPTAGMHFTENLIKIIKKKGVHIAPITLHVGLGTFKPVRAENIKNHKMLPEQFSIPKNTSQIISESKRVIAVGTTTVRALETCTVSGYTNVFIYPPYNFRVVDALVTNFHLPKSTLLMLVSAFTGYDLIMKAYAEAIKEKYRFFSYGDAMLIL